MVVEDNADIQTLLNCSLTRDGYRVIGITNGNHAVKAAVEEKPDLIILEIMLPVMDGFDVLRTLKGIHETAAIPVILLSAKNELVDKVLGLELGANDYITKPFSPREVIARVKAHLRHISTTAPAKEAKNEIRHKQLVIRPEKYDVLMDGARLDLTPKEFELIHLLASHPGRVFTRDILLERIWDYDQVKETRTVDVHIRHLRLKIEKDPANPEYIKTVRCIGYRFSEPM